MPTPLIERYRDDLALEAGDPIVCVSQGLAPRGGLVVNPMTLADGEERIVADRIIQVIRQSSY
jgi:hypothetical protein